VVAALSGTVWGWSENGLDPAHVREVGLNPDDPRLALALRLASVLIGFPRHLSQHVGGFVITRGPLSDVMPITNAAMVDRTVVEWDKDDLDALGILKIDVLALGMLTCIRKALDMLGIADMADVPEEDPAVYDMLCMADSVGVFQVESRAQMTMLPRLKPRTYYDLVIEVAIVRPGPIQGDMVHPYLRRRSGLERVDYPSTELEAVLKKTMGVPLFQEQAMRIAIVAAGFTPNEADGLRRAMATFRHNGTIHQYEAKMIEGMVAKGYDRDFATRCFRQIQGFGEYGFPESHAASFALLVYVSAWIKCLHPAVFACALLNAQPMGFYAPAQIVRDAQAHGVRVEPPCASRSLWDCTLEDAATLRLGLRQIKGLSAAGADALVAARPDGGYAGPADIARLAKLDRGDLEALARGDAFAAGGSPHRLERRPALWQAGLRNPAPLPLFAHLAGDGETPVALPAMALGEAVAEDYAHLRLSLKAHPLALLRASLARDRLRVCGDLEAAKNGSRIAIAGLVLLRQRPGTAKGTLFVTIEDETGVANVIVWPHVFEAFRPVVLGARLLRVDGQVQREGTVIHVIARKLADRSALLGLLTQGAVADPSALARADEVRRPDPGSRRAHYPSRDFR
jgi:error-prone DNA polymerase